MTTSDDGRGERGWQDTAAELAAARPVQPLGVWWLAVAGLALSGLLLLSENLRAYGYSLGATLAVLAVVRALVPARRLGGLVVRDRWVDVSTLLVLGGLVVVLARTLRLT